ncbi:MAG: hypothetical protein ACYC1D_10215, partial [Acidimicrobiales bacterium]
MAGQLAHGVAVLIRGFAHCEKSLGVSLVHEGLDPSFDLVVQAAQRLRPLIHGGRGWCSAHAMSP